jgi:hypothetical protein
MNVDVIYSLDAALIKTRFGYMVFDLYQYVNKVDKIGLFNHKKLMDVLQSLTKIQDDFIVAIDGK